MEPIASTLRPSAWLSFRTYRGIGFEPRSVIFDERAQTAVFLEGPSADLWERIELGATSQELFSLAESLGVGTELQQFLSRLNADGFIQCEPTSPAKTSVAIEPRRQESPEADHSSLDGFISWVVDHGFLFSAHWEITWRCNEKCIHCYNPGAAHLHSEKPDRETNELTTAEVFSALDDLRTLGVFRLTLSGGEPMQRRDFWEIVTRARQMGFSLNIFTNGLKLLDAAAIRLAALYPRSVSLSVYSAEATAHDAVTGIPGSFQKTTSALRQLHELSVPTFVKSIQMNHTLRSYAAVQELGKTFGAGVEIDMVMTAAADGADAPLALGNYKPEELVVMAVTPGSPLYVGSKEEGFNNIQRDPNSSVCGAGVTALALDPSGNISPCNSLPIPCGTVKDHGLISVWTRSRNFLQARQDTSVAAVSYNVTDVLSKWQQITLNSFRECGTHDRCQWCSLCPGLAMLEHGDPLGPSSTNCRLATARMIAAGLICEGETRDTLCMKLKVDPAFGRLPSQRPQLAPSETSRGTGFSPINSALASLGCGNCGGCSSSCSKNDHPEPFDHRGRRILHGGTSRSVAALYGLYATLEALNVYEFSRYFPDPVRKPLEQIPAVCPNGK